MTTPPFLRIESETPTLDVSVGNGRRQLTLSDRAESLLIDDLSYTNRDVIPWVTTKILVLTGGAADPSGQKSSLSLAWELTGASGGREPTSAEVAVVADYLKAIEIDTETIDTVRETIRASALASAIDPATIRSDQHHRHSLRELGARITTEASERDA